MKNCLLESLEYYTRDNKKTISIPVASHLFEVNKEWEKLNKKYMAVLHSIVAKFLLVSK